MGSVTNIDLSISIKKKSEKEILNKDGKPLIILLKEKKFDDLEDFIDEINEDSILIQKYLGKIIYIQDKYDSEIGIIIPILDGDRTVNLIKQLDLSYQLDDYRGYICDEIKAEEGYVIERASDYLLAKENNPEVQYIGNNIVIISEKAETINKIIKETEGDIYYDTDNELKLSLSKNEMIDLINNMNNNGKIIITAYSNGIN